MFWHIYFTVFLSAQVGMSVDDSDGRKYQRSTVFRVRQVVAGGILLFVINANLEINLLTL